MKRDGVDLLIQLAFVEGRVTTCGLYERTVAKRIPAQCLSADGKTRIAGELHKEVLRRKEREPPLTVGALLHRLRRCRNLRLPEMSSLVAIPPNLYRMMERDRISPLKCSPETWRRIRDLCRIPGNELGQLIRRTHQLVLYRASFRTTLARYDGGRNKKQRSEMLERAAEELYARADLPIPFREEERLESLLLTISQKENTHER